jgi:hypothetical protein
MATGEACQKHPAGDNWKDEIARMKKLNFDLQPKIS